MTPTTTIRETLATITACATPPAVDHRPIPGERPATQPLALAIVAAEREPFQALAGRLDTFFEGDVDAALAEDEREAARMIRQIVDEHLAAAHARLAAPAPPVDWTDHIALSQVIPAIARRAADLRFVQVLGD